MAFAIDSATSFCAEDEYRRCCQAGIPIQLIWGKADSSVPYEQCEALAEIARTEGTAVSVAAFEGMPHNVFHPDAKADECAKVICRFVTEILKPPPPDSRSY